MNDAVTALPLIAIALVLVLLYSAISILLPLPPFKRRRQALVCAFLASISLALAGSLTETPTAPIPPAIQSSEIEPTDIKTDVPIEENFPVIQPSEIEPNVSEPAAQTHEEKITCDVFEIKSHVDNGQLFLSLDTDCPDYSEITILIYRSFYEVETLNAYSRNYFHDKSTVGNWRSQRIISVSHADWLAELETHRQEMIRFGSGFTVDRVGDDIEIIMVVPINQEDERFGRRNSNLVGKAVNATGLRIIKREVSINYPIQESSDVIAVPSDSDAGTPDLEPLPPTNDTADMSLTMRAQQLLGELGFDPGPLDGVMGPTTESDPISLDTELA